MIALRVCIVCDGCGKVLPTEPDLPTQVTAMLTVAAGWYHAADGTHRCPECPRLKAVAS